MPPEEIDSSAETTTTSPNVPKAEAGPRIRGTVLGPVADSTSPIVSSQIERLALGSGAVAALLLSLQAKSPINDAPSAPAWFNWVCVLAMAGALALFMRRGARDERWLSGACLAACVHFVFMTKPWNARTSLELASTLSRFLSTTWHGIATFALIDAFALVALSYLCARFVFAISRDNDALPLKIAAWLLGTVIMLFGVRGLIGYASGSVSLVVF